MKIETTFSCGDQGWVFREDRAELLTIGQIRIQVTKSRGDVNSMFSNYKPQEGYEEVYMCEETGIGSGSLFTLGKSIFVTEAECLKANAKRIKEHKANAERARKLDIEDAKRARAEAEAKLRRLGAAA